MRKQDDERIIEHNVTKKERIIDVMLKNYAEKSSTNIYDNSGYFHQGVLGDF
jgi:hypothetical protein